MSLQETTFTYGPNQFAKRPTPLIGWGLFSLQHFEPGQELFRIPVLDLAHGTIVPFENAFDQHTAECCDNGLTLFRTHTFCVNEQQPFRYVNHACNANIAFDEWGHLFDDAIRVIAIRPIHPEDQLLLDYTYLTAYYDGSSDGQAWEMRCACGAENCRGVISGFNRLSRSDQELGLLKGWVIAHMANDEPDLIAWFKATRPDLYARFEQALAQQLTYSERLSTRRVS
ncbi:MAG: SET domain-containing protein [Anaerolineae bacterium]|jgi:hypothetical protein|nr:SET domain-containing protein [Anaerolineae bacterium]